MGRTKLIHIDDEDLLKLDAQLARAIGLVENDRETRVQVTQKYTVEKNEFDKTIVKAVFTHNHQEARSWEPGTDEKDNPPLPFPEDENR
jgi:hypothetical protein